MSGDLINLVRRLNGARSSHYDNVGAANANAFAHVDDRSRGPEAVARRLKELFPRGLGGAPLNEQE